MAEDNISAFRSQAQNERKAKNYKRAVDLYDELLKMAYHDGDEISETICRDFIHYAECLLYSQPRGAPPDEEDLEIAWDCLENARVGYEKMQDDEKKFIGLIDVHDLLGEITLANHNYDEAQNQFKQSSEIGLAHPELSWRLPLNSLYYRCNALIYNRKLSEAYPIIMQTIEFIETQLNKDLPEADKADLNDFKAELTMKADKIKGK